MMKRFVHGIFFYCCENCRSVHLIYVEKGLEEQCNPVLENPSRKPHKPTPFVVKCPDCNTGRMFHQGTKWFEQFQEAKKGCDIFMNVKKEDCGKVRFKWGGE